MERNVGGFDRNARIVVGPILALLGIALVAGILPGTLLLGAGLLLVGAILSVTGGIRWCPIHRMLGINTCSR